MRYASRSILIAASAILIQASLVPIRARADGPFERRLIDLVNQERAAIGVMAMGTDVRLFDSALRHNAWQCEQQALSHTGEGGSSPGSRASASGYPYYTLAETLARGFPSPEETLEGFRGSPAHWDRLMSPSYRDIGVAYDGCLDRPLHHFVTVNLGNSTQPATPVAPLAGPSATATSPMASPTATRTASPQPTATTLPPTATRTAIPQPTATVLPPTATRTTSPSSTPSATLPASTSTAQPSPVVATATPPSQGGGVYGTVKLPGGVPRAGTTIVIDGVSRAVTDASGNFAVHGVGAGAHVVMARRAGMLDARTGFTTGPTGTALGTVTLLAGDLDGNNMVNFEDFSRLNAAWNRCRGAVGFDPVADFDGNGCNGYGDYTIMRPNYGRVGPTSWQ